MTDQDWENRFQQLLDLHLIDVDDDYYNDNLFFDNPEDLRNIF